MSDSGIAFDPQGDGKHHTLTGTFRLHPQFHSQHLPADRDVLVYLPPSYDEDRRRRFAVLYLQDGQNVFDSATSFAGQEWHVDESAQHLIASHEIKPLIIVGIYNTGERRIDEYTPSPDPRQRRGGQADLYGRMLVEELKPFIDGEYRTLRDARHTGLGGASLGGLVTMYLGICYPKVFGRLAALSPSVWWNDRAIVRMVKELPRRATQKIWLDTGTAEGNPEHTIANARALRDALVGKGWQLDKDLMYFEATGAGHNEQAWAARVAPMLQFLFPSHGR